MALTSQKSKASVQEDNSKVNSGEEITPQENDERMWAALSFFFILIVIGVPLWWRMTKVERSYFPYDDIADLRHQNLSFLVSIDVYTCKSPQNLIENIQTELSNSNLFKFNINSKQSEFCEIQVSKLENIEEFHQQNTADIILMEVNSLKTQQIIMGRHHTAYFGSETQSRNIVNFLDEVLLHQKMLLESVKSIISPGLMSDNIDLLRKVRPSPKYDVIFTTVNPQPNKILLDWNNEKVIEKYFGPVIRNLSLLSEFNIKSQWLYLIDLGQIPKKVADHFELTQISHIITPLEKKIGSGVAQNPCINFVLYVTPCEYSPTVFIDGLRKPSNAILSARWGGVQFINPNQTHCEKLMPLTVEAKAVMRTFLFQFRTLLGLSDLRNNGKVLLTDNTIIYPWEIDSLYRMRILELFTSSRITLTSLSQLLGEINNIVITDKVGEAVVKAVNALQDTLKSVERGNWIEALDASTEAFLASEFAFTHPSLLALLYFPDDQKYAVYIPLYLPVMIPVLLSLKNILIWIKEKITSE